MTHVSAYLLTYLLNVSGQMAFASNCPASTIQFTLELVGVHFYVTKLSEYQQLYASWHEK